MNKQTTEGWEKRNEDFPVNGSWRDSEGSTKKETTIHREEQHNNRGNRTKNIEQ